MIFKIKTDSNVSCIYAGILRDNTMDDELMNIPNDKKQYLPLAHIKITVEKLGHCYQKFRTTNERIKPWVPV